MKSGLAVSLKIKYILTIHFKNPILKYLAKKNESLCSHRNLHPNVHSSLLLNSQNVEITQCPSIGQWIKKFWYLIPREYQPALKGNCQYVTQMNFKKMILRKSNQEQIPTYYIMLPFVRSSRKGKSIATDSKSIVVTNIFWVQWCDYKEAIKMFILILVMAT